MKLAPHRICCPHGSTLPLASVVLGVTLVESHAESTGLVGLMARARAMAPAALSTPAPCSSTSAFGICVAVYLRMALTAFGGNAWPSGLVERLASITRATTPLVTPAAMLVPLSVM